MYLSHIFSFFFLKIDSLIFDNYDSKHNKNNITNDLFRENFKLLGENTFKPHKKEMCPMLRLNVKYVIILQSLPLYSKPTWQRSTCVKSWNWVQIMITFSSFHHQQTSLCDHPLLSLPLYLLPHHHLWFHNPTPSNPKSEEHCAIPHCTKRASKFSTFTKLACWNTVKICNQFF